MKTASGLTSLKSCLSGGTCIRAVPSYSMQGNQVPPFDECSLHHSAVSMHLSAQLCVVQAYASALKQAQDEGQPDPPLSIGFTYELCAGIIDKQKSLQRIAAEEVHHWASCTSQDWLNDVGNSCHAQFNQHHQHQRLTFAVHQI